MSSALSLQERYRGSLLGLAIGDALGVTVESKRPGTFELVTEMIGDGIHRLSAGHWTDETSMALCLAASILETNQFDLEDQIERYLRWYQHGYLSSTGKCFDIDDTTRAALQSYRRCGDPQSGPTDPSTAGSSSLARLAPVPLAFRKLGNRAIELAGESSVTTHGALVAVDACRFYAGLILGALSGASKETLLSPAYHALQGKWASQALHPEIWEVAKGSYRLKEPPEIRGTGHVVESLEAALWAFWESTSFRHGALLAVNLGGEADTTGAIYGQMAGAFYGVLSLPEAWLHKIYWREELKSYADRLLAFSERQ